MHEMPFVLMLIARSSGRYSVLIVERGMQENWAARRNMEHDIQHIAF